MSLELERDIEAQWQSDWIEFQPWVPKPPEVREEQAAFARSRAGPSRRRCSFRPRMLYRPRRADFDQPVFIGGFELDRRRGDHPRPCLHRRSRSSIDPYAHIAGHVKIGHDVRIAGMAAIYGFNHGFERTDVPIHTQRQTTKGITIGDGCWIGTNAVLVDGIAPWAQAASWPGVLW